MLRFQVELDGASEEKGLEKGLDISAGVLRVEMRCLLASQCLTWHDELSCCYSLVHAYFEILLLWVCKWALGSLSSPT